MYLLFPDNVQLRIFFFQLPELCEGPVNITPFGEAYFTACDRLQNRALAVAFRTKALARPGVVQSGYRTNSACFRDICGLKTGAGLNADLIDFFLPGRTFVRSAAGDKRLYPKLATGHL